MPMYITEITPNKMDTGIGEGSSQQKQQQQPQEQQQSMSSTEPTLSTSTGTEKHLPKTKKPSQQTPQSPPAGKSSYIRSDNELPQNFRTFMCTPNKWNPSNDNLHRRGVVPFQWNISTFIIVIAAVIDSLMNIWITAAPYKPVIDLAQIRSDGRVGDIVQLWNSKGSNSAVPSSSTLESAPSNSPIYNAELSMEEGIERNALYPDSNDRWVDYTDKDGNYLIPYIISANFDDNEKNIIQEAIYSIGNNTCLRIVPKCDYHTDYVDIQSHDGEGCYTRVGRNSGRNVVQLQADSSGTCVVHQTVVHEFLHTIGLWHEHQRFDRDDYVTINYTNMDSSYTSQFTKVSPRYSTTYGIVYDYRSVMHYRKTAFSRSGMLDTIIPKDISYLNIIGNAKEASRSDFEKACSIYNCKTCMGSAFVALPARGGDASTSTAQGYRGRRSSPTDGAVVVGWSQPGITTTTTISSSSSTDAELTTTLSRNSKSAGRSSNEDTDGDGEEQKKDDGERQGHGRRAEFGNSGYRRMSGHHGRRRSGTIRVRCPAAMSLSYSNPDVSSWLWHQWLRRCWMLIGENPVGWSDSPPSWASMLTQPMTTTEEMTALSGVFVTGKDATIGGNSNARSENWRDPIKNNRDNDNPTTDEREGKSIVR